MGILSIFGKSKLDIGKVVGGAMKGLDQLRYTKEEQADDAKINREFNLRVADSLAGFVGSTVSENSERSKFRRRVGDKIVNMFCILTFGAVACHFFGKTEDTKFLIDLLEMWSFGFGSVIMFLFGGYYAEKLGVKIPKITRKKKRDEQSDTASSSAK